MKKETKKTLEDIRQRQDIANTTADLNRARSFSVGTAFGGITEISMRANDGSHLWGILQPVEVIEIIHQLAANIGCHIHIQPRQDFSSWRDWKYTEEELAHYRGNQIGPWRTATGWPPHPNDMAPHNEKGAVLPPPKQQPGLNIERKDHEPVATKKTVNRRSAKRAAAST
jgi:hypothetical protein